MSASDYEPWPGLPDRLIGEPRVSLAEALSKESDGEEYRLLEPNCLVITTEGSTYIDTRAEVDNGGRVRVPFIFRPDEVEPLLLVWGNELPPGYQFIPRPPLETAERGRYMVVTVHYFETADDFVEYCRQRAE